MNHQTIEGRLFGPGLPGTGAQAGAQWQGERLVVRHAQGEALSSDVHVSASGFNRQQIRLSWRDDTGDFAFMIENAASASSLRANAPAPLKAALDTVANAQTRTGKRFIVTCAAAVLLAVSGVFGAWAAIPFFSEKLAERIPPKQEEQLGELVLTQTRATQRIIDHGVAVDAVRTIGTKLTAGTRFRYRWFISENSELNAFAAPGGVVVVTAGLIAAADCAEEIAGVLAHEIAHAELSHGTRAMFKSMGSRALLSWFWGGVDPASMQIAAHFAELRFSRDAEREADRDGLRRLQMARISPKAMVTMFKKLANQSSKSGMAPPAFLSTHPDIRERIEWLQQTLRESPRLPSRAIEVDWAAARSAVKVPGSGLGK